MRRFNDFVNNTLLGNDRSTVDFDVACWRALVTSFASTNESHVLECDLFKSPHDAAVRIAICACNAVVTTLGLQREQIMYSSMATLQNHSNATASRSYDTNDLGDIVDQCVIVGSKNNQISVAHAVALMTSIAAESSKVLVKLEKTTATSSYNWREPRSFRLLPEWIDECGKDTFMDRFARTCTGLVVMYVGTLVVIYLIIAVLL